MYEIPEARHIQPIFELMRGRGARYLHIEYQGGDDNGNVEIVGWYAEDNRTEIEFSEVDQNLINLGSFDFDQITLQLAWNVVTEHFGYFSGAGDGTMYGGTIQLDIEENSTSVIDTWEDDADDDDDYDWENDDWYLKRDLEDLENATNEEDDNDSNEI